MHELLVRKAYDGKLMGYFGINKTLEVSHEYFCLHNMKRNVQRICDWCITYKQAKSK